MRSTFSRVSAAVVAVVLFAWAATPGLAAERKLGLKLATPDQLRGIPLAATPFAGAELPPRVDLSDRMPPVGDQGGQSSCVGWSVAYALKSYQEKNEERWDVADNAGRANPQHVFSPAFIYNQINNGQDGGSNMTEALNLLSRTGACTMADMPYRDDDFRSKPPQRAMQSATRYRIDFWRQVNVADPKEVKAQLNAGYPVVFGAKVDTGFIEAKRGYVWKGKDGEEKGGHAMILVGYDDAKGAFKIQNSWGTGWGDDGYGWVSYEQFGRAASEAYVCKDALNGTPPPPQNDAPPVNPQPPVNPGPGPGPGPTPVGPNPIGDDITFQLLDMRHNVPGPNGMPGIVFFGRVTMKGGLGRAEQVVVQFFTTDGRGGMGPPVRANMIPFADINGFAATGTAPFAIPPQGLDNAWTCWIPYTAFNVGLGWIQTPQGPMYRPGRADLVARPILFIDNFGVKVGPAVPFFVGF